MNVDVRAKVNFQMDIDSSEAFRILCKTLHMTSVLDEDTKFFVKKNEYDENSVYITRDGRDEEYDERGDLFIALRKVAIELFPNVGFRNMKYENNLENEI